jgi:hypothetical protein
MTFDVNSVSLTLNRINQDQYGSEYLFRNSTDEYRVRVKHVQQKAKGVLPKRERHTFELSQVTFATDTTEERLRKCYFALEQDFNDLNTTIPQAAADALLATSNELIGELFAWQS